MIGLRSLIAAGMAGLLLLAAPPAAAQGEDRGDDQEDEDEEAPRPDPAFQYTKPARANYLRAAVENAIVLGLGYLQYTTDKSNAADWDLTYDWASMRSKLVFESISLDNNRFPTNWITHPGAGILYYTAARSNRLGVFSSFAMSFASSAFWEYVGEWKEEVALNDVIVTPVSGMALSEPLLQIGSLMHRSRQNAATRVFGWLFAPLKSVHDRLDGLDPKQVDHVDDLGLPAEEYHRFRVGAAAGVTHQEHGLTQGDGRLRLESRIVALPDYGLAGQRTDWFDAAEVTDLRVRGAISENKIVDFGIEASLLPFGYRRQDVRLDDAGNRRGSSFLAGFNVTMEYGTHDYDRDGRRGIDRVALVAAGATLEEIFHLTGVMLRTRIDALGSFAGVDAYALPEYERDFGALRLTSVLRYQQYYHGYGATLRPTIELESGPFDAGGDYRVDFFDSITGLDVEPIAREPESPAHDRRMWSRVWLGYSPTRHYRVSLTGEHRQRHGTMPGASATRSEIGAYFGIDLVF